MRKSFFILLILTSVLNCKAQDFVSIPKEGKRVAYIKFGTHDLRAQYDKTLMLEKSGTQYFVQLHWSEKANIKLFSIFNLSEMSMIFNFDDHKVMAFKSYEPLCEVKADNRPNSILRIGVEISASEIKMLGKYPLNTLALKLNADGLSLNLPQFTDQEKKAIQKSVAYITSTKPDPKPDLKKAIFN